MSRSTARIRVNWGATIAASVVGLALLLLVLTGPGFRPQPAQAQTARFTELTVDGETVAEFGRLDEAVSTMKLSDDAPPVSVVLERSADDNLELSTWHQDARQRAPGFRRDATLTVFDDSLEPVVRLSLDNAWPSQYRLTQQDGQLLERVTLRATSFSREPAP